MLVTFLMWHMGMSQFVMLCAWISVFSTFWCLCNENLLALEFSLHKFEAIWSSALWWGDIPPNFSLSENFLSIDFNWKVLNLGLKSSILGNFRGTVEILATHICWKIATFCPSYIFNPHNASDIELSIRWVPSITKCRSLTHYIANCSYVYIG